VVLGQFETTGHMVYKESPLRHSRSCGKSRRICGSSRLNALSSQSCLRCSASPQSRGRRQVLVVDEHRTHRQEHIGRPQQLGLQRLVHVERRLAVLLSQAMITMLVAKEQVALASMATT